jgi:hypothetical protein
MIAIYIVVGVVILFLSLFLRIGYINNKFQKHLKVGDRGYVWVDNMKVPCHISRIEDMSIYIKVGETTEFEWARDEIYTL